MRVRIAFLTIVSDAIGDATFDPSCPMLGEYEVIVEICEDREEGEFGRADPDWARTISPCEMQPGRAAISCGRIGG